jgi:hypothetical protein
MTAELDCNLLAHSGGQNVLQHGRREPHGARWWLAGAQQNCQKPRFIMNRTDLKRHGPALDSTVDSTFATDALFGLLSQLLKSANEELQTPEDVVKFLHTRMADAFAERGEDFAVMYSNCVRDIGAILPWQVHLKGAYSTVGEVEAPHSYMFVSRSGSIAKKCWDPVLHELCQTHSAWS